MSDENPMFDSKLGSVSYEILLEGCLEEAWCDWFEGFSISAEDGHTLLRGEVLDQAALHGLLRSVRDIGLPLVSVLRLPRVETEQNRAGNGNEIISKRHKVNTSYYR